MQNLSCNGSYNVTRDQALPCQGLWTWIPQCGPVTGLRQLGRRCFQMHTQGLTWVNTLSFQLFTFREDLKDLEVLKAHTSVCYRGLGQERHQNDTQRLTAVLNCLLVWDILQSTRVHLGLRQRVWHVAAPAAILMSSAMCENISELPIVVNITRTDLCLFVSLSESLLWGPATT